MPNTIITVAGNGIEGFSGDGGPATQASLSYPADVALGADGGLYITDSHNHRIRLVQPDGTIRTIVGNGSIGSSGDGGPATQARLSYPIGVALDADGGLYVTDNFSHRIRKVGPDGIIISVAGNGTPGFSGDGGPATKARLNAPAKVAPDLHGSLYIADKGNFRIRRVAPDGIITTVAGNDIFVFNGDGGPATRAFLSNPRGVTRCGW
ncbi:MAG: NHL domain-containing protein [Gammaproteobacteria bacterium]